MIDAHPMSGGLPTRIAVNPTRPWYDHRVRRLRCFVNGQPLRDCTRADTIAGHAWAWVTDAEGAPLLEYGRPVERLHVGQVELRWAPAPGPLAENEA
jgi:hypothetical protein